MTASSIFPVADTIDAHVHLWDPRVLRYPWLDGTPLDRRYDVTDLQVAGGISGRVIVVQADCLDGHALAEVEWLTAQAASHPTIVGIVAFAPVEAGREILDYLSALRTNPLVVGVRRLIQDESAGFTGSRNFLRGLDTLAEFDLPFDVCIRQHQLAEVVTMVERTPQVQFVLDHLGKPAVGTDGELWRRDIRRLASLPNIACKLSGLATEVSGDGPVTNNTVAAELGYALDEFGPDRCLFGSDWPVLTLRSTYQRWLDIVGHAVANYSAADRSQIFGGNARRLYRIPPT